MFSISEIFNRTFFARLQAESVMDQCKSICPEIYLRPRQVSADDHLYFCVRSFAANGLRHILQYAFVDDRGNVVLSAFGATPSPVAVGIVEPPEDLAVEPVDPEALEYLLTRICSGATMVGFGKVLQAGLLPAETVQAAASVECAWRRFLRISRARHLTFDRDQPWNLSDAMTLAGLRAPESEDAVMRALAIRDLWSWMDRVE